MCHLALTSQQRGYASKSQIISMEENRKRKANLSNGENQQHPFQRYKELNREQVIQPCAATSTD